MTDIPEPLIEFLEALAGPRLAVVEVQTDPASDPIAEIRHRLARLANYLEKDLAADRALLTDRTLERDLAAFVRRKSAETAESLGAVRFAMQVIGVLGQLPGWNQWARASVQTAQVAPPGPPLPQVDNGLSPQATPATDRLEGR